MKLFHVFFLLLLCTISLSAQNYKQVKIFLTNPQQDIPYLINQNIAADEASLSKENSITVFLNDDEFKTLQSLSFRYEVLIDDWYAYYANRPQLSDSEKDAFIADSKDRFGVENFGYGSMGGYYTWAEVIQKLDELRSLYPSLITAKQEIGTTFENRPIYMVKISDNPELDELEPEVYFDALHHAREPQAMTTILYFMYYLCENYNTDPAVKYLVDNREIFFVPVLNPDGYVYNQTTYPSGGGMWRKNRHGEGIDLNRNYGPYEYWNAPNGGSSTDPWSDTYRGPTPFSELETAAIRDFVAEREIKNALNYHTYSNLLIYPYGCWGEETADSAAFREFAQDITAWNGYTYGLDFQILGYSTRGGSIDFLYDGDLTTRGKILAMVPEVGGDYDGFWPSQSRIFPLAQENLQPNLYAVWVAGAYVSSTGVQYSKTYFEPGDYIEMNVTFRNKGLSPATDVHTEVASLSPSLHIINGQTDIPFIDARSSFTTDTPLSFTIDSDASFEDQLTFTVSTYFGEVLVDSDTLSLIIGVPKYALLDNSGNINTLWTVTASPVTKKWEETTASFVSAPNSYTDSKTGSYLGDAVVTMKSTSPINLSALNNPILSFWTKFEMEDQYDCGVVQISTNNGSTWTSLQGNYTSPASGMGEQIPTGSPVYNNNQTSWVKEEIDLSAYQGSQVKLRFELRSDGSVEEDGWYLDDIGIMSYVPSPLNIAHPNGTEVLFANKPDSILWAANSVSQITIYYSTNGGTSWNIVAEHVNASTGKYIWESVPQTPSLECLVKIVNEANGEEFDISSRSFSIAGNIIVPVITAQPLWLDTDFNGEATGTVNASGSTVPAGNVTYRWEVNGSFAASGIQAQLTLSSGSNDVSLVITDEGGVSVAETMRIDVLASKVNVSDSPVSGVTFNAGKYYVSTLAGEVFAYDSTGTLLAQYQTDAPIFSPVMTGNNGNVIGADSSGTVFCLEPLLDTLWTTTLDGPIFGTPARQENDSVLYAATTNGIVAALDAFTGEVIWTYDAGAPVIASPLFFNMNNQESILYFGTASSGLTSPSFIALKDKGSYAELFWQQDVDDSVLSSPAFNIANFMVYFGTTGGKLYRTSWDGTIQPEWIKNVGSPIIASPVFGYNGNVFIACIDGSIQAFPADFTALSVPVKSAEYRFPFYSTPTISYGESYITAAAFDGSVFVYDLLTDGSNLSPRYFFLTDGALAASTVVTDNGLFALADNEGTFYIMKDPRQEEAPQFPEFSWRTFRGDSRRAKVPADFTTHTNDENSLPVTLALHQNFPNPFNPATVIQYDIPKAGHVTLTVYDVLGKQVALLSDGMKEAGRYTVTFDASAFSSGVYFYRLQSGDFTGIKKMLLVK